MPRLPASTGGDRGAHQLVATQRRISPLIREQSTMSPKCGRMPHDQGWKRLCHLDGISGKQFPQAWANKMANSQIRSGSIGNR